MLKSVASFCALKVEGRDFREESGLAAIDSERPMRWTPLRDWTRVNNNSNSYRKYGRMVPGCVSGADKRWKYTPTEASVLFPYLRAFPFFMYYFIISHKKYAS